MAPAWSALISEDSWTLLRKLGFLFGSGAVLTGVAYVAYRYCRRRDDKDEGFFDVAKACFCVAWIKQNCIYVIPDVSYTHRNCF
jgi:hypothetical protein